ncbi:MAG: aminopeptidase [Candidatus Omnitrophica bacterium]|nr:aminopeptidase [Candidatus Omnitrophota bacterium]
MPIFLKNKNNLYQNDSVKAENMINPDALKAIFHESLKLTYNESCLIVTDTVKENIGRCFYDFAKQITLRAKIMVMEPRHEHAQEPPDEIAGEMLLFDVQFLITDKSLSHTRARRKASEKGSRIASMPAVTEDIINRCCLIDYDSLRQRSRELHAVLSKSLSVRITTVLGTDIVFKIGKNRWFGENGGTFDYPGAFGNLPEGEVSFTPLEAQGTYFVDASFPGLGILESPLCFKVKDSFVYEIEGKQASLVRKRLDDAGDKAYRVAELGIGLNPKAKIIGYVLEDEKMLGTVHIALGNNLSFGGDNDVPLHLDGVILKPDIYVDGRKIMRKGSFIEQIF